MLDCPLPLSRRALARSAILLLALGVLAINVGESSASRRVATPIVVGVAESSSGGSAATLQAYAKRSGANPGIVTWFDNFDWPLFTATERVEADTVAARGAVPQITWDPASSSGPAIKDSDVAAGRYDTYLIKSAQQARSWGKPVMVRFAHEMNGTWDTWDRGVNGNTASSFIAMWRHVVEIFREQGASNVSWVWSPNVNSENRYPFADLYPGDAYVDWVSLDGYNGQGPAWLTAAQVFGTSYTALSNLTRKPMMISEIASVEGAKPDAKSAWIRTTFLSTIPNRFPRVRAVVWFDRSKEHDWRVQSSGTSLSAWKAVVGSPLYSEKTPDLSAVG